MAADVCILVADPTRLDAIRQGTPLPGRLMPFASNSLASAIASIRAYRPKTVAVEAVFAETPAGIGFIEQAEPLVRGILLVVEHDGKWIATPRGNGRSASNGSRREAKIVAPSPRQVAAVVAPPVEPANTRRAPRFMVREQLEVIVESGHASLVDLSVLGAQIVSLPVLRPNQKLKIDLTDTNDGVSVIAQVAWSLFEKPTAQAEPYYRVGLEFTGAARQALEKYRQRHCDEKPLAVRAR
jgi:PilZ domain